MKNSDNVTTRKDSLSLREVEEKGLPLPEQKITQNVKLMRSEMENVASRSNSTVESSASQSDEEYRAAYYEKAFKLGRKINRRIPLKGFDGWMHFRALDGDALPRGKYFDKFRSKCRDTQYDHVMARVREVASLN